MVSIAPNEFRIEGKVLSKTKEASLDNFVSVTISLEKVEQIRGPGEFLNASEKKVAVSMTETLAAGLVEGMYLECRIRKAPGHFFVIPDSIRKTEKA